MLSLPVRREEGEYIPLRTGNGECRAGGTGPGCLAAGPAVAGEKTPGGRRVTLELEGENKNL